MLPLPVVVLVKKVDEIMLVENVVAVLEVPSNELLLELLVLDVVELEAVGLEETDTVEETLLIDTVTVTSLAPRIPALLIAEPRLLLI